MTDRDAPDLVHAAMANKFRLKIVLIVDDEEGMRDLIADTLEDLEIKIIRAGSAEDALAAVRNYVIDLAIVDVFMPGKGGLWLIEELHKQNPEADIIMMSGGWSGMAAEKTLRAARKLGVTRTFTKPFSIDDLLAAVTEIISPPPPPEEEKPPL